MSINNGRKRICCFYSVSFGRNDGSPLYYYEALKHRDDCEVVHLTPDKSAENYGDFDFTFWIDWGEDGLPWERWYPEGPKWGKKIYVASDTHITTDGRDYRFKTALRFDYVFFNQKRALTEFAEWLIQNDIDKSKLKTWNFLPHAVEPIAYPKSEVIKKYDVCFIGHLQDKKNYNGFSRIDALDRLFAGFSNFYFGTRNPLKPGANMFEDAALKFCKSKIVFNISIVDDLNMRLFEAMATGSFLLTNKLPTLSSLFEDGKHLVTYSTLDEMINKAEYYINHDEEREKIALAGQKEVLEKHTYSHRIQTIFDVISNL